VCTSSSNRQNKNERIETAKRLIQLNKFEYIITTMAVENVFGENKVHYSIHEDGEYLLNSGIAIAVKNFC